MTDNEKPKRNRLHNRRSRRWRMRMWIGGQVQRLAWLLCDPHDSWLIDYYDEDGHPFGTKCTGFYSQARTRARELHGKIVGCNVTTVSADGGLDDPTTHADWWKKT